MNPSSRSAVLAVFLAGCGASTTDALTTAVSELVSSQCTLASTREAAQVCFTAFDTCKAAEGAVVDDCKTALKQCLPRPGREHAARDGGACRGHDGGRGRDGGARGGEGRPGRRGGPDGAAVDACHEALDGCLSDASSLAATCFDAERTCVHAAFEAEFQARCAEATESCAADAAAPESLCARVQERCAAGVGAPPRHADGGVACE